MEVSVEVSVDILYVGRALLSSWPVSFTRAYLRVARAGVSGGITRRAVVCPVSGSGIGAGPGPGPGTGATGAVACASVGPGGPGTVGWKETQGGHGHYMKRVTKN